MYWPLGAPRVYAATKGRRKKSSNSADNIEDEEEKAEQTKANEDAAILGLRVSRNGQFFATITSTTLLIWQTSVGQEQSRFDRF